MEPRDEKCGNTLFYQRYCAQYYPDEHCYKIYGKKKNYKFESENENDAHQHLVEIHRQKIEKLESKIPPVSLPTPITSLEMLKHVISLGVSAKKRPWGMRAIVYSNYLFDENGRYLHLKNKILESHEWGVITAGPHIDAEGVRNKIKTKSFNNLNYSSCETIDRSPHYLESPKINVQRIGQVFNLAKFCYKNEGYYLFRNNQPYELGYRGHQSTSCYYLPFQYTRCRIVQWHNKLKVQWPAILAEGVDNKFYVYAADFVKLDFHSHSDYVTVGYFFLGEDGLPIDPYYCGSGQTD